MTCSSFVVLISERDKGMDSDLKQGNPLCLLSSSPLVAIVCSRVLNKAEDLGSVEDFKVRRERKSLSSPDCEYLFRLF